jgi:F-type H+-transporting ATPase subunit a
MLQKNKNIVAKAFVLLLFCMFMYVPSKVHAAGGGDGEKFNAGHMIIGHIVDSYEWHIATIGEKHISIYLPVMLFYEGEFFCFSSKHFHHGYSSYKGFKIEKEGMKKGKIVKVKEDGETTDTEASFLLDISITKNVVGIFVTLILLFYVFLKVAKLYKVNQGKSPKGLQSLLEPLILFIRDEISKPAIGKKYYMKFMPFLLTMFFFIFFANLLGLVPFFPGGANVTGNISVTAALALFTFLTMLFAGKKDFYKHIYNTPGVPWYMKVPIPIMPVVELLGLFTKPFVLMIRLFANITAGHIVALGFIGLIFIFSEMGALMGVMVSPLSVFFYIFIGLLELLVAFIQAYVFTLLSALYFGMAVEEHHHDEHHEEAHEH